MWSRRRLMVLGLGAACVPGARAEAAAASGRLMSIRGRSLYVEDRGPRDAPALIYLHGGPGAGSFDFSAHQGERLSKGLRLIVIDQRGVLRSDPIAADAPFGFDDLIEDCEALRAALGLTRWSVLGHSFGGYLALAYALKHPEAIDKALFENPCWDFGSSARYLMQLEAPLLDRIGKPELAARARAGAAEPASASTKALWNTFSTTTNALGAAKDDLYVHGADKQFFNALVERSGLSKEQWGRGANQQSRLYQEGAVFTSLVPKLHDLRAPSLLLKGRYDAVTPPDQVQAFLSQVRRSQMVVFDQSSHFVHVEEPDRFASAVIAFVRTGRVANASSSWAGVPGAD